MTPAPRSSFGSTIGILVVIVLLALGGLYFWGTKLNQTPEAMPYIPNDASTSAGDTSAAPQGSDDAASIQADLQAQDMSGFDTQMKSDASAASKM
jgi:hypothetical protein